MKYEAHKPNRIKYRFMGITTSAEHLWFYHELENKWIDHNNPDYKYDGKGYSSHQYCSSIRAFRRKLKKCPKGVEFRLVGRWMNNNVFAKRK